jgi:CelD/BcsL family acetyltransferase involved in cellulose biosynthesis
VNSAILEPNESVSTLATQDVAAGALTISTLQTRADVERMMPQWLSLLARPASGQNVYNDPRMISAQLKRHANLVPKIMLLWRDAELIGVAPFYIQPTRFSLELSVRRIRTWPVKALRLFGESVVLAQGIDREPCTLAIADFLKTLALTTDYLWVYGLDSSDPFWRVALESEEFRRRCGLKPVIMQRAPNHKVLLKPSFDEYVASMNSGSRKTLRRLRRRIFEDEKARIAKFTSPREIAELVQLIDVVSAASWQEHTFGDDKQHRAATQLFLEEIAALGWLRSYVLLMNERPIAFQHGYQYQGTYAGQGRAYDQEFAELSPGSVLTYCVLEDLQQVEPLQVWDLGFGDMPYKHRFANDQHETAVVYFVRRNRWRFLLTVQKRLDSAYTFIRSALVRLGADKVIRKTLKRQS